MQWRTHCLAGRLSMLLCRLNHAATVLDFPPGLSVLTGPNNIGKSAVVEALRCLTQNPVPHHAPGRRRYLLSFFLRSLMDDSLSSLLVARRALERRLDRLSGEAAGRVREYTAARQALREAEAFLDVAPRVSARLETLTSRLFGEVLDEIEADLTHGSFGARHHFRCRCRPGKTV